MEIAYTVKSNTLTEICITLHAWCKLYESEQNPFTGQAKWTFEYLESYIGTH